MGINGLSTTLNTINDRCETPGIINSNLKQLATLNGADNKKISVAIDFMELAYHWLGTNEFEFTNNCFKFLTIIINSNIMPIFCFDGMPPEEKHQTIDIRRRRRLVYHERAKYLINKRDLLDYNKYNTDTLDKKIKIATIRARKITPEHCKMFKYILDTLGMDYIHDPNIEGGEMLCAQLQRCGHATYCMTNDLDVFAMGSTLVIRNFNLKNGDCTIYNRPILMQQANLTVPQFIDMCILHGCDYIDRPRGIRTTMILPLIQKFSDIYSVMQNWEQLYPTYNIRFPCDYNPSVARRLFSVPIFTSVKNWYPTYNMHNLLCSLDSSDIFDIINTFMEKYTFVSSIGTYVSMLTMINSAHIKSISNLYTASDTNIALSA